LGYFHSRASSGEGLAGKNLKLGMTISLDLDILEEIFCLSWVYPYKKMLLS